MITRLMKRRRFQNFQSKSRDGPKSIQIHPSSQLSSSVPTATFDPSYELYLLFRSTFPSTITVTSYFEQPSTRVYRNIIVSFIDSLSQMVQYVGIVLIFSCKILLSSNQIFKERRVPE